MSSQRTLFRSLHRSMIGAPAWQAIRAACLLFLCAVCDAAEISHITLVLSEPSGAYVDVAQAIRARLEDQPLKITTLTDFREAVNSGCHLIVPIGGKALSEVAALGPTTAVLGALLPKQLFEAVSAHHPNNLSAVVLDQPLSRQLRLVRAALPAAKRVGALLGPDSVSLAPLLAKEARELNMEVAWEEVESPRELLPALDRVLRESDVLLALPDRVVWNRDTLHSLLLTSYRYHDPVVGFSAAYGKAGALLSLYTTPEQVARQTAETILAWAQGERIPRVQAPKYFTVDVNSQVARSLGLTLPDEAALKESISP